ncbi:nuclear inhibitor of protein phosphatase-1 [Striga asiatica]|uniref:Nuclear inhibitor of protein phosphatase-1 n=1 Tax=Striga asiatica TaxID=4170 RepID=A0A5A7PLS8_STRAF|nr:nuclear inhibitor of protein phosphatase-1 [Striga asiatica]
MCTFVWALVSTVSNITQARPTLDRAPPPPSSSAFPSLIYRKPSLQNHSVTSKPTANTRGHLSLDHPAAVSVKQTQVSYPQNQYLNHQSAVVAQQGTQVGGQPPDWAIEPQPGVYYLGVLKEKGVCLKTACCCGSAQKWELGVICEEKCLLMANIVIQNVYVRIYVIDLGSAHGTSVANERLTKDSPIELKKAGQSLDFLMVLMWRLNMGSWG